MMPVLLWRLSATLRQRGHYRMALLVKRVNSMLFHNSLAPGAIFSPDIEFGHHGFGTVIHSNVEIGRRVKIWHNVTIAVRATSQESRRIVIEDDVKIGAGAVIVSPADRGLRIGRGALIGAGAVVVRDVPAGATVVSQASRVILAGESGDEESAAAADVLSADPGKADLADAGAVRQPAPVPRSESRREPADPRLGKIQARQRAEEAVRDDHVDA